ncbi:MAG: outer membrane lipoprotein carrier protein LolA [Methylovulum sp.]|uniref:LolA family protein n=1 Tax=Methylovulum sp. TaxID=1916980 RepID=UPI002636D1BA|nr:outer membrane lipoprotein carrier protein LolA [Methylovulum sp.]MDD2724162.1 outer membrane lipoprotein carrier protein LolA [Methylovulum sp.]MDD5123194.1 outer membrane lipoprotein carrier protein LolA [Methylovulum sp.]
MQTTKMAIFSVIGLFWLATGSAYAEDSLLKLMQKLKSEPMSKVAYQETRNLKMLAQAWHGSGYLYALPPELMIREQLVPERVLMGVKGDQALYFDAGKNERHQVDLHDDNELNAPLTVFKAIVTADEALLRSVYNIIFTSHSKDWLMELTPKQKGGAVNRIYVSGRTGQEVDKITVLQEDGDNSEFTLQKESGNAKNSGNISSLYQELVGE